VKADELQTLDAEELTGRLKGARRELYELRFKLAVGQLDDNRQIRKVRKDIARILTVVHARRLAMVPGEEPQETELPEVVAATGAVRAEQAVEAAEPVADAPAEPSSKETPEDVEAAGEVEPGPPARASRRRAAAGEEGNDD
jgi:large subunit ribosomal protein L29